MRPSYNDSVFINCPFDPLYQTNLEAIVFAIYRCGLYPVSALNEDNALTNRLTKIENLIAKCKYGLHDISRTELNAHGFPRFNMPFEVGLFFGAKRFGNKNQKNKNALIFERDKFTYQSYFSDLSGIDLRAHSNDPVLIIHDIRNWLKTSSGRNTIPGILNIVQDFQSFVTKLPDYLASFSFTRNDIPFNDLCLITEEFLKDIL